MTAVEACADVRAFFRDLVTEALRSLRVETGESTEHYLVELLAGYTASHKIQPLAGPFVELLAKALATEGVERMYRLRALGDAALFVSGFLADSCERRGITHTYVVSIGARAYGEVSRAARFVGVGEGASRSPVYEELADRFSAFSRVLDEVREQTALCTTDGELVRLYERFQATGSPSLLKRLSRRGVVPHAGDPQGITAN
jgi:hypothetical protein